MGNLNDFIVSNKLTIGTNSYNIGFVPFSIEQEIISNPTEIDDSLQDISKISAETIIKWRMWIDSIIRHKRNENECVEGLLDDFGFPETFTAVIEIVKQVGKRMKGVGTYFAKEIEGVKKKAENPTE